MGISGSTGSSEWLPATQANGFERTRGPKNLKHLGQSIAFDFGEQPGTPAEQAAVRKRILQEMLREHGHEFGDHIAEETLASALKKHLGEQRIKIIVIKVDPSSRESVLKGIEHMDAFGPGSRDRMLDSAITNLGMPNQGEKLDKLCEAIAKNGERLGPRHLAALEGMSRDPVVATALTKAGYALDTKRSYADMVNRVEEFPPRSKDQFLNNAISHLGTLNEADRIGEMTELAGALTHAYHKNQLSQSHMDNIFEMVKRKREFASRVDAPIGDHSSLPNHDSGNAASTPRKTTTRLDLIHGRETAAKGRDALSLP